MVITQSSIPFRVVTPQFALTQLRTATFSDPKSLSALDSIDPLKILAVHAGKEMEASLGTLKEGFCEPSLPDGYVQASLEIGLAVIAKVVSEEGLLDSLFQDDPSPIVCMEAFPVTAPEWHLVFGVNVLSEQGWTPQVRLLSSEALDKWPGAYYRPLGVFWDQSGAEE